MITLQTFFGQWISAAVLEALGWTILHSLWQGGLIAVLLAVVLAALRNNASSNRYAVSVVALVAMVMSAGLTFFSLYEPTTMYQEVPMAYIEEMAFADALAPAPPPAPEAPEFSLEIFWDNTLSTIHQHLDLIVSLWLAGVVLFTFRFFGSLWYVHQLQTRNTNIIPAEWLPLLQQLNYKLRIKKNITVLLSNKVDVPTAIGVFKPVILFPLSLHTGLTLQEIESVLAHELAHIRRNDYLINIFQSLAEVVFFYHPAMWWISSNIREERENCCDDMAVAAVGDSLVYSKTLAKINELTTKFKYVHNAEPAMAFTGKKGTLLLRIKRLFLQRNENNLMAERLAAATIIMAGLLISTNANAALLKEKAWAVVSEVQNILPVSSPQPDEDWESKLAQFEAEGLSVEDTTKKKKKSYLIEVDENGKVDTIYQGEKNQEFFWLREDAKKSHFFMDSLGKKGNVQFFFNEDMDIVAPPMPPLPLDALDALDNLDVLDFDYEYELDGDVDIDIDINEGAGKEMRVLTWGMNGKNTLNLDSLKKTGKKVSVDTKDGKMVVSVDDKVVRSIDLDSIRKSEKGNVMVFGNKNFRYSFNQSSKAFDSLKNTKEYKKKMKKLEDARKEYEKMMEEYRHNLRELQQRIKEGDQGMRREAAEAEKAHRMALREHQRALQEHQRAVQEQRRAVVRMNFDRERQQQVMRIRQADVATSNKNLLFKNAEIDTRKNSFKEVNSTLAEALKADKLIEGNNYSVKFTPKGMFLNGKEQPQDVYEKYKKLLKDKNGVDLTEMLKDKDSMFVISN